MQLGCPCHFRLVELTLWTSILTLTCLGPSSLVSSQSPTPADIDKRFEDIFMGVKRSKHDEPCFVPLKFKDIYLLFKSLDPKDTKSREELYNIVGDFAYCDKKLFLECNERRQRCMCRKDGGYWVPDKPMVDATKNGKCYSSYMTPCSAYETACGPGGICRSREKSARRFCVCLSKNEKDPACVAYKKIKPEEDEEERFENLMQRLDKRNMALYGKPCVLTSPPIFSPIIHGFWKLEQVLVNDEAAAEPQQRLRTMCDFRKNLVCVDNICKCPRRAEWDPVNESCAGKFGTWCNYKYHGDWAEFSGNLTCMKPLRCVPLVPRPYNLASEVRRGPSPYGCCHDPKYKVKYKKFPVLGFEKREETPFTTPHFECPPRVVGSAGGGLSAFKQIIGILGGFLLQISITQILLL